MKAAQLKAMIESGRKSALFYPCLDITVYIGEPFEKCRDGVVTFFETFMADAGKSVAWYATETMDTLRKATPKKLTTVNAWFDENAKKRRQYGLILHSGKTPDDFRPPGLDIFSSSRKNAANFMRMTLPVELLDSESFLDRVKKAAEKLPFLSGHAGYSLFFDSLSQSAKFNAGQEAKLLLMRHPGLDIGFVMDTREKALEGIKGANWLTLLGDQFCQKLGGTDAIREKLNENILIHSLPHGIIIQAGPDPEIGDTHQADEIPLYHEVGKLVAPIRIQEHRQIMGMSREETQEWLGRFDG